MPKVKPFFTHELTVISNADFLALSGGSLKKGASFNIGDADALCMKITDDDKFLNSSRHHDDDDDDDNQTGEIAGQGSVGDVEIGSFVRMKSSTGKKYDLVEIKSDAGSFWTFAGNIPGSDETLTVLHVFTNHKKAKYDKGLGVKQLAAVDDSLTTDEDTRVFSNVLTNDCAPSHSHHHDDDDDDDGGGIDHSNFRVVAVEGGTVGTEFLVTSAGGNQALVRVSANGTVSVDPRGNFDELGVGETDTVTFDYTLGAYHTVGKGKKATQVLETDKGTVTVTITGVNDAPVAVADTPTTDEDNAVAISVLANDSDVEGDTLTVTGVGNPANGTAVINANNTITYTPNADFHGTDEFSYTISDGNGGTAESTVTVTVRPVNDAPVAVDDTYQTSSGAGPLVVGLDRGVLHNDSDVDGDPLTATLLDPPANGTLTLNEDGTFSYQASPLFQGDATFRYEVSDPSGASAIGTVTVNVAPAGPAQSETYAGTEDAELVVIAELGVLANDPDVPGEPLTAELVSGPANGTMVMNSDGSFTYVPDANFNGTDVFRYRVTDSADLTIEVDAEIEVEAVNDAPELTLLSRIGVAGQFSAGLVAARMIAEDVDGDTLDFSLTGTDAFLFRLVEVVDDNPDTHLLHLVARDRDDNGNLLFPNGDKTVLELAGPDLKFDVTITASDGQLEDDLAIFFGAITAG